MRHLLKLPYLFVLLLFFCQCKEEISSKLKVIVLNNQNAPIHDATILIDDIKIGTTNKDGLYLHELKGAKGKALKLEVIKESATHYYAPYFEKIVLSPDKRDPIKVKAILYSVPKPKKDHSLDELASSDDEDDLPILIDSRDLSKQQVLLPAKKQKDEKIISSEKPAGIDTNIDVTKDKLNTSSPVHKDDGQNETLQRIVKKSNDIGKKTYSVHVTSQKKNVADAEVYLGNPQRGYLQSACKTNLQGKCAIQLSRKDGEAVSFVVKKHGYVTKTLTTRVKKKGSLRVSLTRGQCLDVFTLKSNYQYIRGVSGISIFVNGRKVGNTDKFGHLSYVYQGPSDDLLKVSFKTKDYLPEVFETDFITSPNMTLTRFLTDKNPSMPKFTLLPVRLAGLVDPKKIPDIAKVNRYLREANNQIMSRNNATEFPYESLVRQLEREGKKVKDLIRDGWAKLSIKAQVDALILPTIMVKKGKLNVEISLYSNRGEVIAAATHPLNSLSNRKDYGTLVRNLAAKINSVFPFEGAVLGASNKQVRVNLNRVNAPFIEIDDLIEVFGRQINTLGRSQEHKKIAIGKIVSITKKDTTAKLIWQSPRSALGRGDMIILRKGVGQDNLYKQSYPIHISEQLEINEQRQDLPQVNVYLNGRWIGSSNSQGFVAVRNTKELQQGGTLTFVKHGYETKHVNYTSNTEKQIKISLQRLLAFVQLDTKPAGAKVYLDGIYIGKSPVNRPFKTSSGFVKLHLKSPPGYKDLTQVLELEEGVLDLSGTSSIELERDVLKGINELVELGSFEKAISMLEQIDKDHSDYLHAQHLIGEIYLSKLKDPASAANAFRRVVENPRVRSFHNKKFIGSYINYAESLTLLAKQEQLENWNNAKSIYEQIIDISKATQIHLRYAPSQQHALAKKKLSYFEALAMSQLAAKTSDTSFKRRSMEKWQNFVENFESKKDSQQEMSDLLGNAKVYLKQAQSKLNKNDISM